MPDVAAEVFAWIAGIAGTGILARWCWRVAKAIDGIVETVNELKPNGGLSVKDKVDDMWLSFRQHLRDHEGDFLDSVATRTRPGPEITD